MRFSYHDEFRELNEQARREASGSFIQLHDGFTHYELSNPQAERTVVLVHGFSVPYFIYDPTFAFLTRSGFRVLRYDLCGRGLSDRPDTQYNMELFVRQLRDLLEELRITTPVTPVGLSTGGPIVAGFTTRYPGQVEKLVLIDPVGAKPFLLSRVASLAAAPVLGEILLGSLASVPLVKRISSSRFDPERIGEFGPRYLEQMEYKGFKRALLSTVRSHMLGACLDLYEQIGKMDKPVSLFWGRHDATIPFQHSELLRRAMPQVEFHAIEGTGHIPHYEKPGEVNPILLEFLSRQPPGKAQKKPSTQAPEPHAEGTR
jgi:pimeloyl-ACP methyl ester carboxylesterase